VDDPPHDGGCHCGRVRFRLHVPLARATLCNCSICRRKGTLNHRVPADCFELLAGADQLSVYQFGTHKAKHYFCKTCGIHPFSNPRAAPDAYAVNLRCLDKFPEIMTALELSEFDGRHWEEAFAARQRAGW
jgi:hypothetical protein